MRRTLHDGDSILLIRTALDGYIRQLGARERAPMIEREHLDRELDRKVDEVESLARDWLAWRDQQRKKETG
jgi:hypothetical protein